MTRSRLSVRRRPLQASMLIEAVVAVTIVLMAMIAAAQLIGIAHRQRRHVDQTRIAANEVANIMDRLYATAWQDLTDRDVSWTDLSPLAIDGLVEPEFRVSVTTTRDSIATKRCRVQATWIDQSGERVEPIQLVAWKHSAEAPSP